MAIRKISIWPDPVLSTKASPVEVFDDDVKTLVSDMFETMYEANGVGLAANQVAVLQRVLVIDLDPGNEGDDDWMVQLKDWGFEKPTAFINPRIVSSEGEFTWDEGCLSVPGITETVKRKQSVLVEAEDVDGNTFQVEAHGLYSVALQHEMDHLDGKVFVEYLSKLKRDVIKRKMNRVKDEHGDGVAAAAAL